MKYFYQIIRINIIIILCIINDIKTLKNENTLESESLNNLESLSSSLNRRTRYTEDGEECSKIFIQDGKTYYDCTDTKSPDGQDLKKDWCYLESPKLGKKNWGYCKEILDWNKIREQANNEFNKVSEKVAENIKNSQNAVEPIKRLYNNILNLQRRYKTLDNKLLEMNEDYKTLNSQKNYLISLKSQWTQIENDCIYLQNEINKKEAEIEEEKLAQEISDSPFENQQNQSNEQNEITKEYITKNEEILGLKINPLIQQQPIKRQTYPDSEDDYQEEDLGTGLTAKYYDNIYFKGIPKTEIVEEVDLELEGKSPIKDINKDAYSVVFEGYIVPPINSEYTFILKTDDSNASILINKRKVMNSKKNKYKKNIVKKISESILSFVELNEQSDKEIEGYKLYSNKLHLIGGREYKITIKYKHDSFILLNDQKAYIQLLWKCNFFTETQVEQIYLYPNKPKKQLKVIADPNIGIPKRLYENDLAFKDSELFIIQDIPNYYEGLKSIKLNCKKPTEHFTFEVNKDINIYIAIPEQGFIDPPQDFIDTGEELSVLAIEDNIYDYNAPHKDYPNKIYSTDSFVYKIYQKRIEEGTHIIDFNYNILDIDKVVNSNKKKELYALAGIIIFFGSDPQTNNKRICGVQQELISEPNQKYFKTCSASSGSTDCKDGFSVEGNNKWIANSEESSWLQVDFNGEFEISSIVYKNTDNGESKSPIIKVQFSNGEQREFFIGSGKLSSITWNVNPPVISNNVKFIYTNSNLKSGGNFEIYGAKCKFEDESKQEEEEEKEALFEDPDKDIKDIYSLNCYDDFDSKGPLLKLNKKVNLKVRVFCQNACEKANKDIYGYQEYTTNSAICKSAYHSDIIDINGGYIDVLISKGLVNYKSEYKNDIYSKTHQKTEFSMKLYKVDFNAPINETYEEPKIIRIKFAPLYYKISNTKQFLIDNGLEYGKSDQPFGWSDDMSDKAKKMTSSTKRNGPNMLSDTSIDFNPHKKSIWCNATSCERVNWKIKTGKGKYKFKVYIYDNSQNYVINLQVNGKSLVEATKVNKNYLAEFEGNFTADNEGYLVLTDECNKDCSYARSKINFIEISKISENNEDQIYQKSELINKQEMKDIDETAIYGGKCETGEIIENCLYDDFKSIAIKYCKDPYKLVEVSKDYKSSLQRGKVKCVRKQYLSSTDCEKYCPGSCENLICQA